ncbi:MAG: hypothetical protein ACXVRZ_15425, partial [Gaiellaceae bacterium]
MGVSEFDAFQSQLLRLLDLVHERNPTAIERNRLRQAITLRHGDWLGQVRGTPIEGLGRSLVGQLAKADAELTREQVTELDALALGRLPQVNEQRELAPTTATGATVDANIVHDILKPPRRHRVQALLDLQARGLVELAVSGHVREDIPEDPLATELQQLHELDVTGGVFRLDHSRLDGPDALGSQAFLAVQEELGAD